MFSLGLVFYCILLNIKRPDDKMNCDKGVLDGKIKELFLKIKELHSDT